MSENRNVKYPRRAPVAPLVPPVYVLGHASRSGRVLPHLSRLSHTLVINPDWPLDGITMHPTYAGRCPLNHYRVFRGWQTMADKFLVANANPVGLFFEDDAVPNCPDWTHRINSLACWMTGRYDLMYLCGRMFNPKRFDCIATVLQTPVYSLKVDAVGSADDFGGRNHVFGCCAALMSHDGACQMATARWTGVPGDVYFPDHSRFCFVGATDSMFIHDHSQGSLIDPSVPAAYL